MHNYRRYNLTMMFLSLASIVLIILDLLSIISILDQPYFAIDIIFVVIFAFDYIYRLVLYEDKVEFVLHHVFDLLSIIPFYSIFRLFRLSRIFRILRFSHFIRFSRFSRLLGLKMRSQREIKSVLHTNGLIYVLYTAVLLILFSSTLFSVSEDISFSESVWWAIVTATTVGHGEIYPMTLTGRFAAILLMFLGLALIGTLTSSLTTYFSQSKSKEVQKINDLESKVDLLLEKISDMEDKLPK
ncbi:potassium channel family protein [Alkalibacterium sp.]|nr:MAG: ion transporter [Alkalibacterium sp.]